MSRHTAKAGRTAKPSTQPGTIGPRPTAASASPCCCNETVGANGLRILDGHGRATGPRASSWQRAAGHVRGQAQGPRSATHLSYSTSRATYYILLDRTGEPLRRSHARPAGPSTGASTRLLARYVEQCRLVATIRGIDRSSACTILIEAGHDRRRVRCNFPPRGLGRPVSRHPRDALRKLVAHGRG